MSSYFSILLTCLKKKPKFAVVPRMFRLFAQNTGARKHVGLNSMKTGKTSKVKWRRAPEQLLPRDHVSFSVPAPCTHADIVQRIGEELNLRVDPLPETLTQHMCVRGPTIFGSAADVLDEISASHENLYWTMQDGALRFEIRTAPKEPSVLGKPRTEAETAADGETNDRQHRITDMVRRIIEELRMLKPQMHNESHYEDLRQEHPEYKVFKIAEKIKDVKSWVASIQDRTRVEGLAQEIVARHFGIKPATVRKYWSHRHQLPQ
jgi:hypothetical protein